MDSKENINLFEDGLLDKNELSIVKLNYIESFKAEWKELFEGYDLLQAITFSSSINFVWKMVSMFENAEIIFGNEGAIGNDLANLVAFQNQVFVQIGSLKNENKKVLAQRMKQGHLKLWVAKGQLSHEKIYLLSSKDGRFRVITGSANMSNAAFLGKQRETINLLEGYEAFAYYQNLFDELKETSTNEIEPSSIIKISGNIENNFEFLPITEEISEKKIFEVTDMGSTTPQMEFSYQLIQNAKKLKPYIQIDKTRSGLGTVTIANFHQAFRRFKTAQNNNSGEITKTLPELIVDVENKFVKLQGEILDLHPSADEISKDVELFYQYMEGFNSFHGDLGEIETAKRRYYDFANWFFISPFLSYMRMLAQKQDKKPDTYPVFGLIFGNSKAGKTTFLKTLMHFMINDEPLLSAKEFTSGTVNEYRTAVKGIPIIYDDMVYSRFNNHAAEAIKDDTFGFDQGLSNYPIIVISANEDVKVVTGDISRRTVLCRVNIGLDTTELLKNNSVKRIQRNISTSMYRYYLGKVLDGFEVFTSPMYDPTEDNSVDILNYSSKILRQIFKEFSNKPLPEYIREIEINDYFDEKITSSYVTKTIETAWLHNKKQFVVDRKRNTLKYISDDNFEVARLKKELPSSLNPKVSNKSLIMQLDKACDFFKIDFKKRSLF